MQKVAQLSSILVCLLADEAMRVRLKWKTSKDDVSNGGYDESILSGIFAKVCIRNDFDIDIHY